MTNQIQKYAANALAAIGIFLTAACSHDDLSLKPSPEGMIRVNFCQSGTYGAPLSDLKSNAPRATDEVGNIPNDPNTDRPYVPTPIPDGTTLWVAIYKVTDETSMEFVNVKSYRVSGRSMIPCQVDDNGIPGADYDAPLYLPKGKYIFRALGPARKLDRQTEGGELSLYLDNGDWLIANDVRYNETAGLKITTLTEDNMDQLVTLDPLINQTARLKFTIYSDVDDPFVHNLKIMPIGVELSGLQNRYSKAADGNTAPWNWTLCTPKDTLIAYPGDKNTLVYLKNPLVSTNDRITLETHILPTDAMSTPLIVLFNMEVNGNPTQFEMMLNRKIFRAGYSYHYRGKVTINEGVAALVWESVSWDATIPLFSSKK